MVSGIHHSCFTVSNLGRSIAFYRDVLGLELVLTEAAKPAAITAPRLWEWPSRS